LRRHADFNGFSCYVGSVDFVHGGVDPISVHLGVLVMSFLECSGVVDCLRGVGEQVEPAAVLVRWHEHCVVGARGFIWHDGAIGSHLFGRVGLFRLVCR